MINVTSRISLAVMLLLALVGCGSDEPSGFADDPLQLHLTANADGSLKQMTFNEQALGNNNGSFEKLASEIQLLVKRDGEVEGSDIQIDISADPRLRFEFVQRAMNLYAEQVDTKTDNLDFIHMPYSIDQHSVRSDGRRPAQLYDLRSNMVRR